MTYPNLSAVLNEYAAYIQTTFKSHVQVKTGSLRDSIKVWCTIDGKEYQLHVMLNHYWKYLPDPFPLKSAFSLLEEAVIPFQSQRYPFDQAYWQTRLNNAFESDIKLYLDELNTQRR